MGRPLNKKHFGAKAGNQIRVRAKIGTAAEGDGIIVRQKSTKMYDVTVGGVTGRCKLVDKADGALLANEMTITVVNDAGASLRVTKLASRVASLSDGTRAPWTYATSNSDGLVDVEEADDVPASVTIAGTIDNGTGGSLIATISPVATGTPTNQWQVSTDGGATYVDIDGETGQTLSRGAGETVGHLYRVVVTTTAGTVTSNAIAVTEAL